MNFKRRKPRPLMRRTTDPAWRDGRLIVSETEHLPPSFHGGRKNRSAKPYVIEAKAIPGKWRLAFWKPADGWHVHSRFKTAAAREQALKKLRRGLWCDGWYEYRSVGPT